MDGNSMGFSPFHSVVRTLLIHHLHKLKTQKSSTKKMGPMEATRRVE